MGRSRSRADGSPLDNARYTENITARLVNLGRRLRALEERIGTAGPIIETEDEIDIIPVDTTPMVMPSGDTTPSISGANFDQLFTMKNVSSVNVTDFDDGQHGQVIDILFLGPGSPLTNLIDGSTLQLHNSTSYTPLANTLMSFRLYNGVWYEKSRRNT